MATGELLSLDCFECSVCLESMLDKRPVALSCLHTFCTPCIRRLYERPSLTCPTCRTETVVPDGDINNLPVNRDLIKIMEREKEIRSSPENMCDFCLRKGKQVPSAGICVQCVRNLCQKCIDQHLKISVFQSHQVVTKTETTAGQDDDKGCCSKHGEAMEFVCLDCIEPLCVDCVSDGRHVDHDKEIETLKNGIDMLRKRHDKNLGKVKNNLEELHGVKKDILSDLQVCTTSEAELNKVIEKLERKLNEAKRMKRKVATNGNLIKASDMKVSQIIHEATGEENTLKAASKFSDLDFVAYCKTNPFDNVCTVQAKEVRTEAQKYKLIKIKVNEVFRSEDIFGKPIATVEERSPRKTSNVSIEKDVHETNESAHKYACYFCEKTFLNDLELDNHYLYNHTV